MIVGESQGVRAQVGRWIEDGQNSYLRAGARGDSPARRVQAAPPGHYRGPRGAVEAGERENEQLRGLVYENEKLRNRLEGSEHESEQLREEVKQLRAGTERPLREREEIADALTRVMNEAITRLRTQAA